MVRAEGQVRATGGFVNCNTTLLYMETPIGDGSQRACRVELTLNYGFDNATLGKLVGPVFDKIASSMVEAFVKRAQQVYGD